MLRPEAPAPTRPGLLTSDLDALGVVLGPDGGTLRVWSGNAHAVQLVIFDDDDLDWATEALSLEPVGGGVWSVTTRHLRAGTRYAIRVDGPHGPGNVFNEGTLLVEPYARGLVSGGYGDWRSVVVDGAFDWEATSRPGWTARSARGREAGCS